MKQRQNQNSRVSLLERLKLNTLLKRLSLAQLLVVKELVDKRIEKLSNGVIKYDIKG